MKFSFIMTQIPIPDTLDVARGVADWRNRVCETFVDLECENVDEQNFFGSVSSRPCESLRFSSVRSTRQRVVRSKMRIARSNADDFLLSLQVEGKGFVRQAGREAVQRPGDMTLYDTSRPYELVFDGDFSQLIVTFPRSALLRSIPTAEDLTAITLEDAHGTVKLASGFLSELARQCAGMDSLSRQSANRAMLDILAIAVGSGCAPPRRAGRASGSLFASALRFIEDNLIDPDLDPSSVAKAQDVSVRYLNMAFARQETSLSRSIWRMRIDRCARDLRNPALAGRSITQIAFDWGFNDSAHFARAFKAAFGMTPSEYRRPA